MFSPIDLVRGLFGVAVMIGIAYAFSTNRRAVNWRLVGVGIGLQLVFALLVLYTGPGEALFRAIGNGFDTVLSFTYEGSEFIFGRLGLPSGDERAFGNIFAFQVLPTIVFFASLMAALYHLGLVQPVVKGLSRFMAWALRISGAESLATAANVFIGQTEAPLVVEPYVKSMTRSELMTLMVGGMSTIAGGVLAAYISFLGGGDPAARAEFAGHFLSASIMSAPAAIVMAKILVPETEESPTFGDVELDIETGSSNLLDAAADGASEGLRLALNVGAMLLAFIALIAMINFGLGLVGNPSFFGTELYDLNAWIAGVTDGTFEALSLEAVFGFVFAPLAWAMGVEAGDILQFGTLLGQKIAVNEFVAFASLGEMQGVMSERSIIIGTYALCGFANFSSIAIQLGGIGGIAPERRGEIAALGLRAVVGGALASWTTASIAGILVA